LTAKGLADTDGTDYPRRSSKITDDLDVLLEFYNYPAPGATAGDLHGCASASSTLPIKQENRDLR